MIHFVDLPLVPLQYIFSYLTRRDVLNMRLTCSTIFQSTKCSDFYDKVQICMSKIKVTDLEHFQKFCDEHASELIFNTEGCLEERLEWILPYVENVQQIIVNVRYLKQACTELNYVKHMVVNYIYTDNLKYSDIDFSCLSSAERLNQLSIKGPGLYLYGSTLEDIIIHTKQILKICFEKIEIRKINYFD